MCISDGTADAMKTNPVLVLPRDSDAVAFESTRLNHTDSDAFYCGV